MGKRQWKQAVLRVIAEHADSIIRLGEDIFHHPELGYKEERTAKVVIAALDRLGVPYRSGLALTGVKGYVQGAGPGPTIGVFGELDAVICHAHPASDGQTGAAHACGHHAQLAALIGVAIGLVLSGVMGELGGRVCLLAVPAEEYVELEYRQHLREQQKIQFFGGKQELLARGELADIQIAMMVHALAATPERKVVIQDGSNGFLGKTLQYVGQEAHAGGAPHQGINALNAALLGIMGIHAQRETFADDDHIRVHPIITKGGDLVNIVPSDVRMELYVRGRNIEAIDDANRKVNRALCAGAMAVGADLVVQEIPGYLPLVNDQDLAATFAQNIEDMLGHEQIVRGGFSAGSTDMGDVTQLLPGIQPVMGGFEGRAHARDFAVADPHMAYIVPAQAMALTIVDLLWDQARLARQIVDSHRPALRLADYISLWTRLTGKKE